MAHSDHVLVGEVFDHAQSPELMPELPDPGLDEPEGSLPDCRGQSHTKSIGVLAQCHPEAQGHGKLDCPKVYSGLSTNEVHLLYGDLELLDGTPERCPPMLLPSSSIFEALAEDGHHFEDDVVGIVVRDICLRLLPIDVSTSVKEDMTEQAVRVRDRLCAHLEDMSNLVYLVHSLGQSQFNIYEHFFVRCRGSAFIALILSCACEIEDLLFGELDDLGLALLGVAYLPEEVSVINLFHCK